MLPLIELVDSGRLNERTGSESSTEPPDKPTLLGYAE